MSVFRTFCHHCTSAIIFMWSGSLPFLLSLRSIRRFEKLEIEIQNLITILDIKLDFIHVRGHPVIYRNGITDISAKGITHMPFTLNISKADAYWKSFYYKEVVKKWSSESLTSKKKKVGQNIFCQ